MGAEILPRLARRLGTAVRVELSDGTAQTVYVATGREGSCVWATWADERAADALAPSVRTAILGVAVAAWLSERGEWRP